MCRIPAMRNAQLSLLILTAAGLVGDASDSSDVEQHAQNVDRALPSQSTNMMRRTGSRPMPEVTVFSVDAAAHPQHVADEVGDAHGRSRMAQVQQHTQHSDRLRAHGTNSEHADDRHRSAVDAARHPKHEDRSHKQKEPDHRTPQHRPPEPTSHGTSGASALRAANHQEHPSPRHSPSRKGSQHRDSPPELDLSHSRHTALKESKDREQRQASIPSFVMSQSEDHGRATSTLAPQGTSEKAVDSRKEVKLGSAAVVESKAFAEQLISQEREKLCPRLPSRISLEIQAANAKIAEEVTFVFRAKLTTEDHNIPNQAKEILRTGIEVEWRESSAGTTNDEQSALARAEDELLEKNSEWDPISRGAKLILPLAACDLMNETFSLMCKRGKKIHADGSSASLSEQENFVSEENQVEASLRQIRELYLSLPGGLGVIVDEERKAYAVGLKRQEHLAARDPQRRSLMQTGSVNTAFPSSFSWLRERPQCLDYVHNQGDCGACYMFAALDSLSDRHCIDATNASRLGKVDHLSVQMALLCEPLGRQCSGGWADVGFNYSVYFGLQTASKWPYERSCLSDSECQFGKQCFSPSSYGCPSFFSQEELDGIATFSDALRVTKHKCETSQLEDPDSCKVWAETMFAMSPTMVFMPESCFCSELVADWEMFHANKNAPCSRGHGDGSGVPSILLQEHRREDDDDDEENSGFNFFHWLSSLFFGSPEEEKTSQDSTTQGWNSDIPGGSWNSNSNSKSGSSSVTLTTTTVEQCSRDRCLAEPQPHKATRYHYIVNQKDVFKMEIYNDGPFYTSYYVYEDFTWFFQFWPEHGYNYQWGAMQGGHAVVLVGWESSCQYHGDKIAIPGDNDPVQRSPGSSRRRQSTGECWHLRNTWGDEWGDKGYFRFLDDMLTGPPGYHLHIASAAADGPKSVETVI